MFRHAQARRRRLLARPPRHGDVDGRAPDLADGPDEADFSEEERPEEEGADFAEEGGAARNGSDTHGFSRGDAPRGPAGASGTIEPAGFGDGSAFVQPQWAVRPEVRPEVMLIDTRDRSRVKFRFTAPQVVIGTDEDVHLRVRGEGMAPRHAVLQALHGGLLCLAGQPGGLTAARRPSAPPRPADALMLQTGSRVRLGPYELRVRRADDPPAGAGRPRITKLFARSPAAAGGAGPSPTLCLMPAGGGGGIALGAGRPVMTVGGRPGADVLLQDPSAHALHALLLYGTDGPWVVDLRSREGTRVNGRRVRRERVGPGDEVTFGGESVIVLPAEFDSGGPAFGTPPPVDFTPAGSESPDGFTVQLLRDAVRDTCRTEFARQEERFAAMLGDVRSDLREELAAIRRLDEEVAALREALENPGGRVRPGAGRLSASASASGPVPAVVRPAAVPGGRVSAGAGSGPVRSAVAHHADLAKHLANLERDRAGRWSALFAKLR